MTDYYDSGSSSGSRTTVIIVGIVAGVVLVFLLVCGGLMFLGIRAWKETMGPMMESFGQMANDIQQSQVVANDFLENVRSGRLQAAYESTTENFKKRLSRKAFDELVQKHPELKQQDAFPMFDMNQDVSKPQTQPFAGPYRYRYSAARKDGKDPLEFKITVAKENGTLKVDQLTLYKEENGIQPTLEGLEQKGLSQQVAGKFLEDIRADRLDAAYQSTTEGFRNRISRRAFEEMVQKHPQLKQQDVFPMLDVNPNAGKPQPLAGPYRYRCVALGKNGKEPLEFTITVVKENGTLKVDQLTLYKEETPKEEKPKEEKPK